MIGQQPLVAQLACALSFSIVFLGCPEPPGCPSGTVLVDGVCETTDLGPAGPDASSPDAGSDGCMPMNFYADEDNDGAGAGEPVSGCSAPEGYVGNDDDCDDSCAVCNTGAEVCDLEDNDCDGEVDEACPCTVGSTRPCGPDTGECSPGTQTCVAGGGFGACMGAVGPATELCNGRDDDCDGQTDNGNPGGGAACGTETGECTTGVTMCTSGTIVCSGIGPVAETCNGRDDDCSGQVDEGLLTTFYRDQDGDMRGTPTLTTMACSAPSGYVANNTDCNDTCNVCWTNAMDTCDGQDNDCVGGPDQAFACVRGAPVACTTMCGTIGRGTCTLACGLPAAAACTPPAELCNNTDEDCDSHVDEGLRGLQVFGSSTGSTGSGRIVRGDSDFVHAGWVGPTLGYLERRTSTGASFGGLLTLDNANVVSVDVARLDNAQWVAATAFANGSVTVRRIGRTGDALTVQAMETVNAQNASSTGGIVRVAANSATDAMVLYQSNSTIRVAHVDFSGSSAPSASLPGTTPRAEQGLDIAPRGVGNGYVVAWVTGASQSVNLATITSSLTPAASGILGAGTNPTVDVRTGGVVGVAYAGTDNRPRYHELASSLNCTNGSPRNTCAVTVSTSTITSPIGAANFRSTLEIDSAGTHFWLAMRVSDGALLLRIDSAVRETIRRTIPAESDWVAVESSAAGLPTFFDGGFASTFSRLGCGGP